MTISASDTCYYYIHLSSIHPLTLLKYPLLHLVLKPLITPSKFVQKKLAWMHDDTERERYMLSLSPTGPLEVTRASQKGRCASTKETCHIPNDRKPEGLGYGGVQLADVHTVPARSGVGTSRSHLLLRWNWDRNDPSVVFNRQYRHRALASPGMCMGGQEGRGVLGRTVKKGGTEVSRSREGKGK